VAFKNDRGTVDGKRHVMPAADGGFGVRPRESPPLQQNSRAAARAWTCDFGTGREAGDVYRSGGSEIRGHRSPVGSREGGPGYPKPDFWATGLGTFGLSSHAPLMKRLRLRFGRAWRVFAGRFSSPVFPVFFEGHIRTRDVAADGQTWVSFRDSVGRIGNVVVMNNGPCRGSP